MCSSPVFDVGLHAMETSSTCVGMGELTDDLVKWRRTKYKLATALAEGDNVAVNATIDVIDARWKE